MTKTHTTSTDQDERLTRRVRADQLIAGDEIWTPFGVDLVDDVETFRHGATISTVVYLHNGVTDWYPPSAPVTILL